jgi:hypothetical protein
MGGWFRGLKPQVAVKLGSHNNNKLRRKMNLKKIIIAGAAVISFLTLASSSVKAVATPPFTNSVSITATAVVQGSTNTVNGITTISTTNVSINTKQLLAWLAADEFADHAYGSTTFPTGSQLILIVQGDTADFQVVGKSGNFLVDVGNILSVSHGDTQVDSGKVNGDLFDPSGTQARVFDFYFDDTFLENGADLSFYLQGMETKKITDSKVKSGSYTESVSTTISSGTGDGTLQGTALVVTGTISLSGKETLGVF